MEYCHKCNCCPCRCHCCCPCPTPVTASFIACKRDRLTAAPLPGATYTLYREGLAVKAALSDMNGALCFSGLMPGQYELVESAAPEGYRLDTVRHKVTVDALGNVTIDGQAAQGYALYDNPLASLVFRKTDANTGLPLAGATFTLLGGMSATSDSNGLVNLGYLAPGTYTMQETGVPLGYLPISKTFQVQVSANNEIMVNGAPIADFVLENQPYPTFSFRKYDADTNQPLANAVFTLSNGAAVTSDSGGLVQFGKLAPGAYTMRETAVPSGYEPNNTLYNVVVTDSGQITINGTQSESFSVGNTPTRSPVPVIDAVVEDATTVTGRGVAGAEIQVTLPDGTQVNTTVNSSGVWVAAVPTGITLQAGQTIYATQTVPGSATSERASFIVQSRT